MENESFSFKRNIVWPFSHDRGAAFSLIDSPSSSFQLDLCSYWHTSSPFGMGLFFPQIVNLDHIHNHVYSKEILSSLNRCKSPAYIKKLLSIKGTNLYKISQEDIDANHIQSLVDAIYLAIKMYKEN